MNRGCLIGLIAVVVIATAGLIFYFSQQNKKEESQLEFEKPLIENVEEKTIATGTINPRQEVDIKPQVSGVVELIYVEEGQLVDKGQPIAKIKLVPSEVSVNSARSNVELARIRLADAKRELQRQREVFDGKLDVADARLNYENAKEEEARQKQLYEDGLISRQEYEAYKLDLDLAKTAYENAQINSGNSLQRYEADVDLRQQELNSALNNLQLLKEGVTNNSRQVSNVILSTVSGMVLDIPVKEGTSVVERNTFNEGTSIATIANMDDLIFEGKVDESDVNKLRTGMPLKLKVGAIPNKSFNATLEHISPKGMDEEGSIKFEVRASIVKQDSIMLRAGYSANGDIILNTRENVITVNERDVLYENDSTFVEIKNGENIDKKAVKLGISDGIRTEVISGLDTTQSVKVQQVLEGT